ncbi:MAG TPA: bifunctional UDP-sugar hydrolase/5'-nucleotidase [Smithellaceae bacterium]|nr:bifunctional UDP-sugar hydrolase/5'-nucleotidase [Smithellaceae bacterium]
MKLPRAAIIIAVVVFSMNVCAAEEKFLTIVHTNDMHSSFQGFSPELDYQPLVFRADGTMGGWSRLATIIGDTRKEKKHPVLVVDSGDYTVGSLFHMLAREEAFEIRLLAAMGYDAIGLGAHEFCLKPEGLARSLMAAKTQAELPVIVFAGAVFSKKSDADDALERAFAEIPVTPYTVIERDGVRIGIFGIMGKSAAAEAATYARPVDFRAPVEVAREIVQRLRQEEKVDVVVCLSHGGLNVNSKKSEDEILARKVSGIDVIVSGCSHHLLEKPLILGKTIIVQAGAYGRYVGVLDVSLRDGKVKLEHYQVIPVNSSVLGDKEIQKTIDDFKDKIDKLFLSGLDLSYDKVLARTEWDLKITDEESPLGNLIADSMRWYVNKVDPSSRATIALEFNGVIRDHLMAGRTGFIAVGDLFRTIPLGGGMDRDAAMGYPLVSFYLYPYEIKRMLEILTSIYPQRGNDYYMHISGVRFVYNPHRVIYDRVTDIEIGSEEEGYEPLDYSEGNRTLYRVASNSRTASFLRLAGEETYRFLDVSLKDRRGRAVRNLAYLRVDENKYNPGIQELKQWRGLIEYVQSFKDTDGDGVPDMPEKYRDKLDRIVARPSWNPVSLISRPTLPTVLFLLLVALLFFGVVSFLRRAVKKYRKRRGALQFKH